MVGKRSLRARPYYGLERLSPDIFGMVCEYLDTTDLTTLSQTSIHLKNMLFPKRAKKDEEFLSFLTGLTWSMSSACKDRNASAALVKSHKFIQRLRVQPVTGTMIDYRLLISFCKPVMSMLRTLQHLTYLHVAGIALTARLEDLPVTLQTLVAIESDLSHLTMLDEGYYVLGVGLLDAGDVSEVAYHDNASIDVKDIPVGPDLLPNLRKIFISRCWGVDSLFNFQRLPNLKTLVVHFSPYIAAFPPNGFRSLKILDLSGSKITAGLWKRLITANNGNLRELYLDKVGVGASRRGFVFRNATPSYMPLLRKISFAGCTNLTPDTFPEDFNAKDTLPDLKHVNLSASNITSEAVKKFETRCAGRVRMYYSEDFILVKRGIRLPFEFGFQ